MIIDTAFYVYVLTKIKQLSSQMHTVLYLTVVMLLVIYGLYLIPNMSCNNTYH